MISDGRDYLGKPPHKTQVCIVGTGQAGITLAWYLLKRGIDVTLLEGSRHLAPAPVGSAYSQAMPASQYNENLRLYNGLSDGLFKNNEPEFLIRPTQGFASGASERERIFGGTSTHWGGQSRPLDALTFEKRPGFPGWPIDRSDLDRHYAEACSFLGLYGDYFAPDGTPGNNFSAEFWAQQLGQSVAELDGFDVDMYQFVPGQNLQFQALTVNGATIGQSKANVILNASLLNIEHHAGESVQSLTVGVMEGSDDAPTKAGEFIVVADTYVLACGAVSNAHLMLLSDIGNPNDLVGRYLMGQPIATHANAVSTSPSYLTPSEQQLLSYQNPNNASPKSFPISLVAGLLTPTADFSRANSTEGCWFTPNGTDNFYHGLLPTPESRISLAETTDPVFGQPQAKADWVLSADEQRNYEVLTKQFAAAVAAKGGGPVTVRPWDAVKDAMVYNGHHLGTTRMSLTSDDGVVDKDLKVHTVDNLYVAGSSIWASAGVSNPTFSIVAFSIRLAEQLAHVLGSAQRAPY